MYYLSPFIRFRVSGKTQSSVAEYGVTVTSIEFQKISVYRNSDAVKYHIYWDFKTGRPICIKSNIRNPCILLGSKTAYCCKWKISQPINRTKPGLGEG